MEIPHEYILMGTNYVNNSLEYVRNPASCMAILHQP